MSLKRGLAAVFIVAISMVTAQISSHSAGRRQRPPPIAGAIPSVTTKKEGPNFHQQRLIALFGSETQPVYGNRDPTTGRIMFVAAPSDSTPTGSGSGSNHRYAAPGKTAHDNEEIENSAESHNLSAHQHHDEVDRRGAKVPAETNEINPFDLLPPQFHDLLKIPIHDYGNGTTYNPYDKYKLHSKNKYPLVSTGYANTKYQGSPSNSTTMKPMKSAGSLPDSQQMDDYDYVTDDYVPIKSNRRPVTQKPKVTTTTTSRTSTAEDQQFDDYSANRYANRLTTKKQRTRPLEIPKETESVAVYRPNKPQIENGRKPARPSSSMYDDDNNLQSESSIYREQVSAFRPDNRPEPRPFDFNRPEYSKPPENRAENRPDKRPSVNRPPLYQQQDDEQEQEDSNDWLDRPNVSKPSKAVNQQGGFRPLKPTSSRPKPTFDDRQQPSRPNYSAVEDSNDERSPSVITSHQSYRPAQHSDEEQIAEIKVTPKPFYAVDENQNFNEQPSQKTAGLVDDEPDIIYDYDDERNKGDGVFFMVDSGPSGVAFGPDTPPSSSKPAVTPSPVASPYPTVASREPRPQYIFNPAFRPSAPVPSRFHPQPIWSQPQQLSQQHNKQQSFGLINEPPRPPFRFPTDQQQVNAKTNQPPNILPLFRPNTNPTDEFQFIKHPQQIEFQRQQPSHQQQPVQLLTKRPPPGNQQEGPQRQQRPSGLNPLPSALQSPFSSISQSVANFFIRRSGKSYGDDELQHSDNVNPTVKTDRSELVDLVDVSEIDNTGWSIVHPEQSPDLKVDEMRIARDAESGKPAGLYVSREQGPSRINNGQIFSSDGTARFKPTILSPAESQRRSNFRPNNIPSLQSGPQQTEDASIRKPLFPISSSRNNKVEIQTSGWSPSYHNLFPLGRPTLNFAEAPKEVGPSIQIPRAPPSTLARKDTFISNPTLVLHNNPSEWAPLDSALFRQLPTKQVTDQGPSNVVTSVPQVAEAQQKPLLKRKTTPSIMRTTTAASVETNQLKQTAKYATIQQEDGKQIAVVHPAYIVTYKSRSGSPEMIDLDIPFVPSVESPSSEGELTSIPFEKWHVLPQDNIERKGEEPVEQVDRSETITSNDNDSPSSNSKLEYYGGFQPIIPRWK